MSYVGNYLGKYVGEYLGDLGTAVEEPEEPPPGGIPPEAGCFPTAWSCGGGIPIVVHSGACIEHVDYGGGA